MNKYLCPVCGYGMDEQPANYHICPSCGTEFGLHDQNASHEQLRNAWIRTGPKWWSTTDQQPEDWNPFVQLANLGINVCSVSGTGASFTQQPIRTMPRLMSATDFTIQPSQDLLDWAGRAWGRSEDRQPASESR